MPVRNASVELLGFLVHGCELAIDSENNEFVFPGEDAVSRKLPICSYIRSKSLIVCRRQVYLLFSAKELLIREIESKRCDPLTVMLRRIATQFYFDGDPFAVEQEVRVHILAHHVSGVANGCYALGRIL